MTFLLAAVAFLAAALTPAGLQAQGGWMLDLAAGRAVHDPLAARIGTDNLMLGVRYSGARPVWFYLSGGAPFSTEGSPWGATGAGGRISSGALPLGLNLGAHLFGFTYSNTDSVTGEPRILGDSLAGGATLELLPGIASRLGPVDLELHSGLVQYTVLLPAETTTRRVHHSAARASLTPDPLLGLEAEGRYLRTPEGDFPYVGGTLHLGRGMASAWAAAGQWLSDLSDEISTPYFGAGLTLRLGERLELQAAWQQEATDPLYWNPPRRSWTVQLTHRFGRRAEAAMPVATRARDGRIVIRIPRESSSSAPYILGEFTGWQPVPMVRSGGHWEAVLAIAPGVYRYGFRTQDGRWFIPSSVPAQVDDGMGGTSAVLIVSPEGRM